MNAIPSIPSVIRHPSSVIRPSVRPSIRPSVSIHPSVSIRPGSPPAACCSTTRPTFPFPLASWPAPDRCRQTLPTDWPPFLAGLVQLPARHGPRRHGPRRPRRPRRHVQHEHALHLGHRQPLHRLPPVAHPLPRRPRLVAPRRRPPRHGLRGPARPLAPVRGPPRHRHLRHAPANAAPGRPARTPRQGVPLRLPELLCLYAHAHLYDVQRMGHGGRLAGRVSWLSRLWGDYLCHQG